MLFMPLIHDRYRRNAAKRCSWVFTKQWIGDDRKQVDEEKIGSHRIQGLSLSRI